jgi:hypothetical protein
MSNVPYRNPYTLELALARVIGWAWFVWVGVFIVMWVTSTEPEAWEDHMLGLFLLVLVAGVFIGSAEGRAAKEHGAHEAKMQAIIHSGGEIPVRRT